MVKKEKRRSKLKKSKKKGLGWFQKLYLFSMVITALSATIGAHILKNGWRNYLDNFLVELSLGLHPDLYQPTKRKDLLLQGKFMKFTEFRGGNMANFQNWDTFQIGKFSLPLPLRHPSYQILPMVNFRGSKDPEIGVKAVGPLGSLKNEFMTSRRKPLKFNYFGQKIFTYPVAKKVLKEKSFEIIWRDIFSLDLTKKATDPKMVVYGLFILDLRDKFFPKDTVSFSFIERNQTGVIEIDSPEDNFKREIILKNRNGWQESYVLKSRKNDYVAEEFRRKVIALSHHHILNKSEIKKYYTDYMALPFYERIGEAGFIYMYSLWSLTPDNKEMLAEVIHFLERGQDNFRKLKPLYDYAYRRYGTNFSTKDILRRESDEERLKRKELEEERRRIRRGISGDADDLEFDTPDEGVWHKLQESKGQKRLKVKNKIRSYSK